MAQIKERQASSGKKRLFSKTFFSSVLTTAREMPKTKGKNPDKMCQLIFRKIYPPQWKQWHKNVKSYWKLHNTHEWKS